MKKITAILLALAMLLTLAACGGTKEPEEVTVLDGGDADSETVEPADTADTADAADGAAYKVAIVQQLDHASLDEIRVAIEAELDAAAAAQGITITYDEFNGQNDPTILAQIGAQVVDGEYNAVVPIATLAAQTMVTAVAEMDTPIPVVYAAISDPESAGLTGMDFVTGTSDALNTEFILDMMLAQQPEIKTVGLLYSNSEVNSATPIAQAKAYLDAKGIACVEKTGTTPNEIKDAVTAMVGQVDAVFTPTDNVVMDAELAIYEDLIAAGLAHYTGADSFVRNGAFATCGVNYTELGTYTADMVVDALVNGNIPEFHVMDGGIITVNTETAAALGLDYSVFSTMAGTVNEVVTTED